MKCKITVFLVLVICFTLGLAGATGKPHFYESISNPDKTLDFNIYVFHHKYQWIESNEGNYSTISMVLKNEKDAQPLEWKNYKVYLLLKDGTSLFHNYDTVAKTGNYACTYTVTPDAHHVQLLCFQKKFSSAQIDKIWVKMTASNFIKLAYNKGTAAQSNSHAAPKANTLEGSGNTSNYLSNPEDNSMESVRTLLMKFLQPGCDYAAVTKKLRPTDSDYRTYFSESAWQVAKNAYNDLWNNYPMDVKPDPGQTELLLWKATVNELKNSTGDAKYFPGGYKNVMHHIRPGQTIFRFKFVKPGSDIGMAFDGLVFINGHWVLIPKPWRVLKQ
ncbi:MAG: hypothetical protein GY757_52590 [bacterium]|nr:hypothetical protein [bacterium]